MQIAHRIKLDLQSLPAASQCVIHAKQGESYTRAVEIELYSGGQAWTPPTGATYQVCYSKPDGKGGTYSTYQADGENPAVTAAGNVLTVTLIPQMLEVAGMVRCEVHMQSSAIMAYVEMLSTFAFFVSVQASAESGITSTDYWASARADKVVLLNANVSATADATATHNVSDFLSTPHVGDAVVGENGYAAVVTQASGSTVTIKATGVRWLDAVPSSRTVNGKSLEQNIRLTASDIDYQTQIGDEQTQSVDDALGLLEALAAENDVAVFSAALTGTINLSITSSATFAEIAAAYDAKKQVLLQVTDRRRVYSILPLATFVPDLRAVFVRVDANGYYMRVTLSYDASSKSNSWEYASGNTNADAVIYGGKIGAETAASVAMALDTLAVGNPLDMTDDYTASGAASVEQWATMAAAQAATEGATRPAPKYRVSAGRYRITEKDDLEAYDVSILDVPSDTGRVVLIKQINSDPFLYCSVYTATAPGATANNIFFLSTEEHLLGFGAGKNMLLPQYSDKVAGGDYDKFLQLTLVGQNVIPKWKKYEAKDIPYQNQEVLAQPLNVEEALDTLYEAGILDATELYENSGAGNVVEWAGMEDARDATEYRVPSGTYRVRDSDSDGNYVEHIVTIVDTTYELDNGQVLRYRMVEDKFCGNEPCIIVDCYQFGAPGEQNQSLRYYGDDEEFVVNGVNKHWLPEVTAADNGKCLRVVDGEWQPAPFTEIKSVAALPQNPDPNVLYLIREAEST